MSFSTGELAALAAIDFLDDPEMSPEDAIQEIADTIDEDMYHFLRNFTASVTRVLKAQGVIPERRLELIDTPAGQVLQETADDGSVSYVFVPGEDWEDGVYTP